MKKILIFGLVFFAFSSAEIKIEQIISIYLPSEFDTEEYWKCEVNDPWNVARPAEDSCEVYSNQERHSSRDFWCTGVLCQSIMDSNVYLIGNGRTSFSFYALSGATHSFKEVVLDELAHMQRCGNLCATEENMDSIFAAMDAEGIWSYDVYTYIIPGINDDGSVCDGALYPLELGYSSRDDESMQAIVDSLNALTSIPYSHDFNALIHAENGLLLVPANLEGTPFALYALNGRVLRAGRLKNQMLLPREPVVLRIKGMNDLYLK